MHSLYGTSRGRTIALCLGAVIAGLFVLTTAVPTARAATGSGWNIITSPNTSPSQSNILMGTTCTNAWNCWAVGGVFANLGNNSQPNALVDHWNGSTWSVGPEVAPPATQASLLWSVDCVTASDCWAVGAQEENGTQQPVVLAEHWNGVAWAVAPTPGISGYLFSVTCTGTSDCWAVGNDLDSQKNPLDGIILNWNGSQWTQVSRASSGQSYDQFDSVTCTGSSDCWAVGYAGPNQIQYNFLPGVLPNVVGSQALVEHWNGAHWSIVPTPAVASPEGQLLSSVACTSSSDCWAVGTTTDNNGSPTTTLTEHWDGSTWAVTPSPGQAAASNLLSTVTCVDASDCWATGASGGSNSNGPAPFIENWNGSAWSIDPSPNVLAFGYLSGLACAPGTGCFATGFAATDLNNNTTTQTLIEQLNVQPSGSQGLWMAGSDGGVFSLGNAAFFGSAGGSRLNAPVVGMSPTPDGGGYWLVGADGGVFSFGDADFHGSTGGLTLNKPVVGMAATPDGGGYWLVASDGGVFSFGDAAFHGSTGSMTLNKPIVGMAATPDGGGYWLVASDGGVFAFGDAVFHGSTGSMTLDKPIVGMAATPDGGGYWLVASDGGVFAFGNAAFYGSVPGQGIVASVPIEGMVATADGGGYWIVGQDGSLYAYGDASFLGSLVGDGLAAPIVGAALSN
jgi:hypothetical protein